MTKNQTDLNCLDPNNKYKCVVLYSESNPETGSDGICSARSFLAYFEETPTVFPYIPDYYVKEVLRSQDVNMANRALGWRDDIQAGRHWLGH